MISQTKRVQSHDRKLRALELRKGGMTYRAIGVELGVSGTAAWKAVEKALRETIQEPADDLRKLELERLDALTESLWPMIVKERPDNVEDDDGEDYRPSLFAVDRVLRVMERRAKLLGLDAPVRQEVSGAVTTEAQVRIYLPDNGRGDGPPHDDD